MLQVERVDEYLSYRLMVEATGGDGGWSVLQAVGGSCKWIFKVEVCRAGGWLRLLMETKTVFTDSNMKTKLKAI